MNGYDTPRDVRALNTIQDWLAELTYKPGTAFHADFNYAGEITIYVQGSLFNTYSGDQVVVRLEDERTPGGEYMGSMRGPMVKVAASWTMPPIFSRETGKEDFRRWLRFQLHDWECHESDEWLKEKGNPTPLFDPHRADKVMIRSLEETSTHTRGV